MFELWKLKRQRRKTAKLYDRAVREAKEEKKSGDDLECLYAEAAHSITEDENAINAVVSDRLVDEARNFDVEIPPIKDPPGDFEPKLWEKDWERQRYFLNAKGRSTIRKLIDEEKTRRFEVRARFVKLALPIITALAGLIGVITGLAAVLRK